MTRAEAIIALRAQTGCSLAEAIRHIPGPGDPSARVVLAAAALQGLLAGGSQETARTLAWGAAGLADAMLVELGDA